ncbi:MAG: hypothetical protein RBU30_08430 [Polyangia bacterium]|jgi:predicted alpha/beta-hydrolase family hydrolase|nr:hypothetical protein [Polyangia bacterium]
MTRARSEPVTLEVPGSSVPVTAVHTPPVPQSGSPGIQVVFLLGHGIANDRESPLLVGYLEGLALHGVRGLRFNFPFKERKEPAPDPRDLLFATLDSVIGWARGRFGPEALLVLGGKSLSARVSASHQARFGRAQAMAYLGYPLHPPDDRGKLRGEDLQKIPVPQYLAVGDLDPFCDLDLLSPIREAIQAPFHLEVIEGGDHGLGVDEGADPERAAAVLDRLVSTTRVWIDAQLRPGP